MSYVRILRAVCPRCESRADHKFEQPPSAPSEQPPWPTPEPQPLDIFPNIPLKDQLAFADAPAIYAPEPSVGPSPVSVLPMEMTDVGSGRDAKGVIVSKIYLAYFLPGREHHLDILVDRALKFYCMESADFALYPELKDLGDFIIINRLRVLLFLIDQFQAIYRSQVRKSQGNGGGVPVENWLTMCGLWPPHKMATHPIAELWHILSDSLEREPFTINSETVAELKTTLTILRDCYRDRFCSFCVARNVSMFASAKLLDSPCLGHHGSDWFFEDRHGPMSHDEEHLNQLVLENMQQPNGDMSGILYVEAILPTKPHHASGGGLMFVDETDNYPNHEGVFKRLQGAMIELGFGAACLDPWGSEIHQYYTTKLGNQVLIFSRMYLLSKRALLIRLFKECRRVNIPCPLGETERVVVDLGR